MKIEAEALASSKFCQDFGQELSAGLCRRSGSSTLSWCHVVVSPGSVAFLDIPEPEGSIIMKRSEKCSWRLGLPDRLLAPEFSELPTHSFYLSQLPKAVLVLNQHCIILGNLSASPALAQTTRWLGPYLLHALHRGLWGGSDLMIASHWEKGFENSLVVRKNCKKGRRPLCGRAAQLTTS